MRAVFHAAAIVILTQRESEMLGEWFDIKELDKFREYYEFCDFVVVVDDSEGDYEGDYTDIVFGIRQVPKRTIRFLCIPEYEEST